MIKKIVLCLYIETYYYKRLWAIEASKHENLDGFRTKKTAHFIGKPENFSVWWKQVLAYISETSRDAVQRKLCQKIVVHLNDATLQMIISQNNRKGFEMWKNLQKTFGQIRTRQIIVLWQQFLELKKNGESTIEFLNKVDNIVFKIQSADEKISDNLKIAIVLKVLPQEYDSFIAAYIVSTIESETN